MNYECELGNGQHLELRNEGDQTFVSFSRRGVGQEQRQGHGFATGPWSSKPAVYRLEKDYVVRVETSKGVTFFQVEGNQTTLSEREPELSDAEEVELKESTITGHMKPMQPMQPMRPMEPMKPMQPMKPMRPMS